MAKKIKIVCAKAQYERMINGLKSYFEDNVCFLGRSFKTCPGIKDESLNCDECLRRNIIRVAEDEIGG